jgi:hypothetical protein
MRYEVQNRPGEIEIELVEDAMLDLLESSNFRSSKQCQLLLRYIVDNTLAHQDDLLRERVIGARVFGRSPDYDTGNDPVVRARVAEVRKRLAQYYLQRQDDSGIQISIPSGSYKAVFSPVQLSNSAEQNQNIFDIAETTENLPMQLASTPIELGMATQEAERNSAGQKHRLKSWISLAALLVVVAILGGLALQLWQPQKHNRPYEKFWAPFSSGAKPILLYIGASPSYHLSPGYLEGYLAQHPEQKTGPGFYIDLQTTESIPTKELLPINSLIGFGDVAATARIASTLMSFKENYDLRYGNDISITDLRSSPVVLIGGYSNSWSLQVTHNLRYTLEPGDRIIDHQDKSKLWERHIDWTNVPQNDYAVLSRLVSSETGNAVLVIAGIGTASNQATADFVSDPQQIDKLLQNAPHGWEHMNMQAVLHTQSINGVPTSADVQATYFW